MPFEGDVRAAPVPGCVDGWVALHASGGRLPFAEVLAPAITLAAEGFPCSPLLAALLPWVWERVPGSDDLQASHSPPRAGTPVRRPLLAATLRAVADGGRGAFYEGRFGAALVEVGGGEYAPDDLAVPLGRWVEPLGLDVWGHRIWTVPPGSQGYLTLAGAWIASQLDLPDPDDGTWAHLLVESARAAGHDRGDVLHEGADGAALLDLERLAPRAAAIRPDRRAPWPLSPAGAGDTMYLAAIDAEGRGVSLIQSNASGFGCGVAVPGTGVLLHNRGVGFTLEPGHRAEYGPRRRPPSTLSPAFVTRADGGLDSVVGTMGGDSQPQILLQVLTRLLHHDQSPSRAVGSPRWVLTNPAGRGFDTWQAADPAVRDEADAPEAWRTVLIAHGHEVQAAPARDISCGHAQVIRVERHGGAPVLAGAADPRARVGAAIGF
jgi:gamma-glutamyltranspeptidase/glutathione hydrolase